MRLPSEWTRMRTQRVVPGGASLDLVPLPRRWRDTTTMLLSNPVNRQRLFDAIAELDRAAALRGRIMDAREDAA